MYGGQFSLDQAMDTDCALGPLPTAFENLLIKKGQAAPFRRMSCSSRADAATTKS